MYRVFYARIAFWSEEDPQLARWALDDLICTLTGRGISRTGPRAGALLFSSVVGGASIDPNWREDPQVQEVCRAYGYTAPPPPAGR